jgi:hypothetical protein
VFAFRADFLLPNWHNFLETVDAVTRGFENAGVAVGSLSELRTERIPRNPSAISRRYSRPSDCPFVLAFIIEEFSIFWKSSFILPTKFNEKPCIETYQPGKYLNR